MVVVQAYFPDSEYVKTETVRKLLLRARGAGSVGADGVVAQQLDAGKGSAEAGARARAAPEAAAHR